MERVQLMSENCLHQCISSTSSKPNDQSNLLKGILLLTLGVILGISVSAAVYKISQPKDLSHLPRNRAIRNLNSSETNEVTPLLQICRSQLASTQTKLKEATNASETVKGTVKDCEASKELLKEENAAMTAKLQKEKNACETVKGTLKTCEANNTVLTRELIGVEAKCGEPWWTYFKATNSCYYYQGYTYNDKGDLNTFLWSTAERHCVGKGAHLVSIHSVIERDFLKKMILSDFKDMNAKATDTNACAESTFSAWIGLLMVDGVKKWSDGTAYDYDIAPNGTGYRSYMMCHDVSMLPHSSSFISSKMKAGVNVRFVCKKPAIA